MALTRSTRPAEFNSPSIQAHGVTYLDMPTMHRLQRLFTVLPTRTLPHLCITRLEGRLGVLEQHLEVGLVPGTGLGSGLEGVVLTAVRVVAGSRRVGGTVGLTAGLDPDEGISLAGAGAGGRADTEAGAVDVAPVTPLLAETLDGVAASVDDGLAGHTGVLEERAEGLNVDLLVLALVPLGVGSLGELSWAEIPCVPTGDVGGEAADLLGRAGVLVDLGEFLRTGLCELRLVWLLLGGTNCLGDILRLSFQPSQPPWPASMYMAMLGRLSCLSA